jgi:hypothetical protein
MEPNTTASGQNSTKHQYSLLTVSGVGLLSLILGGGLMFSYMYLAQLEKNIAAAKQTKPAVVTECAPAPLGVSSSTIAHTVAVNYAEPDPAEVKNLTFPTFGSSSATSTVQPKPVAVHFPTTLVSADYQKQFNVVINSIAPIETELTAHVVVSMALVQQNAAAAKYMDMFAAMQQAKKDDQMSRDLANELLSALKAFTPIVAQQSNSDIKTISSTLIDQGTTYANLVLQLADQNDAVLTGSIPTQEQLDAIQKTASDINTTGTGVRNTLLQLSTYIKTNTR